MKKFAPVAQVAWALFAVTLGCSGTDSTGPSIGGATSTSLAGSESTGGLSSAGGGLGTGGASQVVNAGGTAATGGSTGAEATGGAVSTGGRTSSSATGGVVSSGGSKATGGSAPTGGGAGVGGSSPAGGSATGGSAATGGSKTNGGSAATGGSKATGGTPATGGVSPTGGSKATGGATATGGGSAGTTGTIGKSGYPAAGASGQAQPTGAGTTVTVLPWAGFKGAISLTHDDTNQSQIDNYPALEALNDKGNNARFTFYMQTGKTAQMSSSVWPQALKDGHELGNHTKSHSPPANTTDIQAAEDTLKSMFGITAYSFAAPNGDSSYITAIPTMKEFLTNRTAGNSGGISFTDNPSSKQWQLPCIIPAQCASSSAMSSPLISAVNAGQWEINLVHGFSSAANCAPGSDGAYQPVDINQYTAAVTALKAAGNAWIDTVGNVSAYWIAGYNFSKLTPTTSGTDKTWTWSTANFNNPFPPGQYLRVTTNGGTLKQGSTVLQWDDHGYYEVSLDAGTLTLSQ